MDSESIKIHWWKGTGRDACTNVPNPGDVDVGEGCKQQQVMQAFPGGLNGSKVSLSREHFLPLKEITPHMLKAIDYRMVYFLFFSAVLENL